MSPQPKQRLDLLLVERGLCSTRAKAQGLILAGQVSVNDQRVDKPGSVVRTDSQVEVRHSERYVSRGGVKLEGALDALNLNPDGQVCVDVGASTGGFTDCLLQRGARRVYAVDVGWGLLASKLVQDERVVVRDRSNARNLTPQDFPEPIDWIVVDASFIGVGKFAAALYGVLRPGGIFLCMIKPQFEVGREQARQSKGVIRDPVVREQAIADASADVAAVGFSLLGGADSVLAGPKGNLEHFLYAQKPG